MLLAPEAPSWAPERRPEAVPMRQEIFVPRMYGETNPACRTEFATMKISHICPVYQGNFEGEATIAESQI